MRRTRVYALKQRTSLRHCPMVSPAIRARIALTLPLRLVRRPPLIASTERSPCPPLRDLDIAAFRST